MSDETIIIGPVWAHLQSPINDVVGTTTALGSTVKSVVGNVIGSVSTFGKGVGSVISTTVSTTVNKTVATVGNTLTTSVNTVVQTGYSAASTTTNIASKTKDVVVYPLNYVATRMIPGKKTPIYEMTEDIHVDIFSADTIEIDALELTNDDINKITAEHLLTEADTDKSK
jgi:hypothetical protein